MRQSTYPTSLIGPFFPTHGSAMHMHSELSYTHTHLPTRIIRSSLTTTLKVSCPALKDESCSLIHAAKAASRRAKRNESRSKVGRGGVYSTGQFCRIALILTALVAHMLPPPPAARTQSSYRQVPCLIEDSWGTTRGVSTCLPEPFAFLQPCSTLTVVPKPAFAWNEPDSDEFHRKK